MKNNIPGNITIGLIDGLTIPFALVAGLSAVIGSTHTIFTVGIVVTIAYALTMTMGAYLSAKKYEPSGKTLTSSLTIGLSYIVGGCISIFPYLFISDAVSALKCATAITLPALFVSGYYESKLNGAHAWTGAWRIIFTGAIAALLAFGVALLFK